MVSSTRRTLTITIALLFAFFTQLVPLMPSLADESPMLYLRKLDSTDDKPYFDVTIKPGESQTLKVQLENGGASDQEVVTWAANLEMQPNGGYNPAAFTADPVNETAWLSYETERFELAATSTVERSFEIAVPKDAAPGEYTTALVLQNAVASAVDRATPETGDYVLALQQISRFILGVAINVPGDLTPAMAIGASHVETDSAGTWVVIDVENTGNARLKPQVEFSVTGGDGASLISGTFQMDTFLAHSSTVVRQRFGAPPAEGLYSVAIKLEDVAKQARAEQAALSLTVDSASLIPMNTNSPTDAPTIESFTVLPTMDNAGKLQLVEPVVVIQNPGVPVLGATVTMSVYLNGRKLEDYVLGSGLTIAQGATELRQRYLPLSGWQPGTYTFTVTLGAVSDNGGVQTVIATADAAEPIIVP